MSQSERNVPRESTQSGWRSRTALQLFLTCWIVYAVHFTTDVVREHYPAIALGDHLSFRLDEYGGLHPDLFEKEGYGWHIGNNPGISIFAAIPYALSRPIIDPLVTRIATARAAAGLDELPTYDTPWENDRRFFAEVWRRGLDIKLALAAFVTHFFFMAPICAAAVVLMWRLLKRLPGLERSATWLALLYAFGTPLFYRAGFLNHNMVLGIIAFAAFVAVWNPGKELRWSEPKQFLVLGLAAGLTLLFDYSGVVFAIGLFLYGLAKHPAGRWQPASLVRRGSYYSLGALGPLLLLWFYQWRAFGHPFWPGQHWMPPVEWSEIGYQGYSWPQLELLWALGFDHQFGLFVFSPLLLLAFAAPALARRGNAELPAVETAFLLLLPLALWVFFAGSNYTRLQFNTGVRYMAPAVPFLFVAAAVVLARLRPRLQVVLGGAAVALMWCLCMYRDVGYPLGVLDPVARTLVGGFSLPALRTLQRTGGTYLELAADGVSPLPLFLVAAVLIFIIWAPNASLSGGPER